MSGIGKCEKLPLDKKQISKVPNRPAIDITAPDGKTVIEAGVYHPISDSKNLVEPNGAGITNTIGRPELAANAAALTHEHKHVATDSLSSFTNSESKSCTQRSTDIMYKEMF
eukprot:1138381-Pelagomonas_calceolata.AAC.1